MKAIKKVFALLLTAAMVLGMATTALAAEPTYSITINDAVSGQTYTAYKIFNVTYSGTNNSNVAYSISSSSDWFNDVLLYMGGGTTAATANANGVYTGKGLTLTPSASDATKFVVTATVLKDGETKDDSKTYYDAADFATFLSGKTSGKTVAASSSTTKTDEATTNTVTVTLDVSDSGAGYYFVDTSLGALSSLDTVTGTQKVIYEKNEEPKDEKKIIEYTKVDTTTTQTPDTDTTYYTESNGIYTEAAGLAAFETGITYYTKNAVDSTSKSVGDIVDFEITVTAGGAADTSYVVHDTMSDGLTLNKTTGSDDKDTTFTITVNGTVVDSSNYTISYSGTDGDGCTFEITFNQTYTASLDKDTKIVISYSATLNENAVDDNNAETNKTHLTFGNSNTVEDTVTVYSFAFDILKVDDSNTSLSGAEFDLYDSATGGNKIPLVFVENTDDTTKSYYRPATATEQKDTNFVSAKIKAGTANIQGLAAGTYYLEETTAPAGYNMLDSRVKVEIAYSVDGTTLSVTYKVDDTALTEGSDDVQVVNQTGSELPQTGGIGTTIFYVIGSVLVIGAAVLLITKKRMSGTQE